MKLKKNKSKGVACEHLLKQGIAEIILDYAKDKSQLHRHGKSWKKWHLRCFSWESYPKISKKSPIPVLVVPCHN